MQVSELIGIVEVVGLTGRLIVEVTDGTFCPSSIEVAVVGVGSPVDWSVSCGMLAVPEESPVEVVGVSPVWGCVGLTEAEGGVVGSLVDQVAGIWISKSLKRSERHKLT